jgi:hypothetical protein
LALNKLLQEFRESYEWYDFTVIRNI